MKRATSPVSSTGCCDKMLEEDLRSAVGEFPEDRDIFSFSGDTYMVGRGPLTPLY